jgi:transposase
VIVAETGGDVTRFATSARLAAWAGLAPGPGGSAGKRKHATARQGNRHLRGHDRGSLGHRPHPHPAPGSAAWPAGSARAMRKKPPSRSPGP